MRGSPLYEKGRCLLRMGCFEEAVATLQSAKLDTATKEEVISLVAVSLRNLGSFESSSAICHKIIASRSDNPVFSCRAYHNLATIERIVGKFTESLDHLQSALNIIPDNRYIASYLGDRAGVYAKQGRFEKAIDSLKSALSYAEQLNAPRSTLRIKINLGYTKALAGHPGAGFCEIESAIKSTNETNIRVERAWADIFEGYCHHLMGNSLKSISLLESAIQEIESMRCLGMGAEVYRIMAEVYTSLSQIKLARRYARTGFSVANKIGELFEIAKLYEVFGLIDLNEGHDDLAEANLAEARAIFNNIGVTQSLPARVTIDH